MQNPGNHTRNKKSLTSSFQPLTLQFTEGKDSSVQFDLCNIVSCKENQKEHTGSVVYICEMGTRNAGDYETKCGSWSYVITNTGSSWGYQPQRASKRSDPLQQRLTLIKGYDQSSCGKDSCNPLILTLKRPQDADTSKYVLGAYESGKNLLGHFVITVIKTQHNTITASSVITQTIMPQDKVALETGFAEKNEWLKWMTYTTEQSGQSDCIACARARPQLATTPFQLNNKNDPKGLQCVLQLFGNTSAAEDCKTLSLLFPPVQKASPPPSVTTYKGNYTCFDRSGQGHRQGPLPETYCQHSIDITSDYGDYSASWFLNHITMRADLWWLCGDMTLRPKVPKKWRGSCALVQLVMPFFMFSTGDYGQLGTRLKEEGTLRHKRSVPGGSFDNRVYIDSIGVPRGVPDEFKARNQITGGLESLLFWWSTVNKNVDWINYIYYNQQHFVNYTRDAVKGIAEQLGPTSLTAWQNRMALDMLLAEKGGVCKMFGTFCCTFIPNNTSPDGSITKALARLTSLSEELAENSGIKHPFSDFLDSWFGRSVPAIFPGLQTCYCIPCFHNLLLNLNKKF
uniref:Uncharacterized protein n=1 Tax=Scophthalmus maximus TaxID=52904 RepID=A0A8D3E829_SCOMX